MQFSIKTKLKRIVSATLASLLMLTSTPMVSAANGWDEAEHKRWVTCTTCGGAGSYKTACPPTVSTACYRCPDMSKKQGARGFIYFCSSSTCDNRGNEFTPRWEHNTQEYRTCCNFTIVHFARSEFCPTCNTSGGNITGTIITSCISCGGTGSRVVSCSTGSYQYDTAAPTLSATKSIDAHDPAYAGQAVTVTATATDSLSGVYQYKFDDAPWQSSNTTVVPNTAGAITVKVQVKDSAGNISATRF